ncbi:MAG: class I SAM-dependent methyltransferase, partial [Alphaproteobacteria bacterium]|nr:class I SAM-dependent methyltransferase [Alphaproteobacteria bacterium]
MTEYQFTNNWFGGNIPTWDYLMNQFKPATILEIGSFEGRSTCYIIEKCSSHHAIDVTCIDSWEGGVEEHQKGTAMSEIERRFDHNVALAQSRAKNPVTLNKIKMHSVPACCRLMATRGEQAFDLIYVDGSHQAPDVLADA